jgi:ribonuclease PH
MDMNVVMVGAGSFVEVQGTAEGSPFSQEQMTRLLGLAKKGIEDLIVIQKKSIGKIG